MYKNEKQLQAACVVKFRELYPEYKNALWSVRNYTANVKDGMTQRALGMLPGVSDLQYFFNGRFVAIEIKLPGTLHDKDHLKRQLKYGLYVKNNGGEYYVVKSVSAFLTVINNTGTDPEIMDVWAIEKLIEETKNKKVKF